MTDYDFFDADRPERKRGVQRTIEMKGVDEDERQFDTEDIEDFPELRDRAIAMSPEADAESKLVVDEDTIPSNTDKGGKTSTEKSQTPEVGVFGGIATDIKKFGAAIKAILN